MLILGIETSCDETGAAIIKTSTLQEPVSLLSNVIATSLALHAETGGIIPEVAAREQVRFILPVIEQALKDANCTFETIDAIAVTYGPGLIGSLLVGIETAKTLSYIYNKPLIPVNHLYGHIYANWLIANSKWPIEETKEPYAISHKPLAINFPALALVVSGGHTDLVLMKNHGDIHIIGGTRDDAAGEAFDKIGRLLGLPYPAGPLISKIAKSGNPNAFVLPRPLIGSGDYDFSFSGLKTAVLNLVKKNNWDFTTETHKALLPDLCASVEEAIVDSIVRKTLKAAQEYRVHSILLGGGVAANDRLKACLRQRATDQGLAAEIFVPAKSLCTDNAAMIASAGFYHKREVSWQDLTADPELYF